MNKHFPEFIPKNFKAYEIIVSNLNNPPAFEDILGFILDKALSSEHIYTVEINETEIFATETFLKLRKKEFVDSSKVLRRLAYFAETIISVHEFTGQELFHLAFSDYWRSYKSIPAITVKEISFTKNETGYGHCLKLTAFE